MEAVRVKLVCMTGGGLGPGETKSHYLPDHEGTTYIISHDSEGFEFTENLDRWNRDDFEILGKLRKQPTSAFSIVLEVLVDEVLIEPDYSPRVASLGTAKIGIPPSEETANHYIILRPNDTFNFSHDGVKIAVMAEIPDSTSSPQPSSDANITADGLQDEVQVKSSNVDSISGEVGDASDTSDDDLDQTVTGHASMGETTPARGEQAIMETPQGHPLANLPPDDERAPFSTALEAPTSETVPLMDSPTNRSMDPSAYSEFIGSPERATSEPLDLRAVASMAAQSSYAYKRKAASMDGDEDLTPKSSKKPKVMEEQYDSSPEVVVAAQRPTKKGAVTSTSPPSSATSSALTGKVPNILLSNDSPCRKGATATFLKKQGATIIDDVKTRRAHFVCVLNGDKLTTTAKVLRSLALGKLVVTEEWINESKKAGQFLDPDDFIHEDLKPTINIDRRAIFRNHNLFFTKGLANAYGKGWKDIQELAKEAGASHVDSGSSGDFGVFKEGRMDVICFGQSKNDVDVPRLRKTHGVKIYHKNLLTESIRKGELDLDGEEHVLPG